MSGKSQRRRSMSSSLASRSRVKARLSNVSTLLHDSLSSWPSERSTKRKLCGCFLLRELISFDRISTFAFSFCLPRREDRVESSHLFKSRSFRQAVSNYRGSCISVINALSRILDALAPEESDVLDDHDDLDSLEPASVIITSSGRPPSAILGTRVSNYDKYRRKLEPLVELEQRLIRLLSSPDEDEATHLGPSRPAWEHYAQFYKPNANTPPSSNVNNRPSPTITIPNKMQTSSSNSSSKGKEIVVHTSTNWKKAFSLGSKSKSPKSAHTGEIEGWWEDPEDPVHTLNACAPAMQELWRDPQVRKRLQEKRLRLEESSGLYANTISFARVYVLKAFQVISTKSLGLLPRSTSLPIVSFTFVVTNVPSSTSLQADVLKARLKTMGVVEHTFSIPSGSNRGVEWKIYDVGGSRNQRQAWAPYFEDSEISSTESSLGHRLRCSIVTAIIFLAPISAFDQVCPEAFESSSH